MYIGAAWGVRPWYAGPVYSPVYGGAPRPVRFGGPGVHRIPAAPHMGGFHGGHRR